MSDVTRILNSIDSGGSRQGGSAEELFPLVYEELRRIAAAKMAKAAPGQTLQATALVHEAWLRLVGMEQPSWTSRRHFFRTAALAMQQILVDVARRKQAKRHGGGLERVNIEDVDLASATGADEFLRVHEALERLVDEDPEKAEIVRLRYFVGLEVTEVAELMGLSQRTVERHWTYAKAWIGREIESDSKSGTD